MKDIIIILVAPFIVVGVIGFFLAVARIGLELVFKAIIGIIKLPFKLIKKAISREPSPEEQLQHEMLYEQAAKNVAQRESGFLEKTIIDKDNVPHHIIIPQPITDTTADRLRRFSEIREEYARLHEENIKLKNDYSL